MFRISWDKRMNKNQVFYRTSLSSIEFTIFQRLHYWVNLRDQTMSHSTTILFEELVSDKMLAGVPYTPLESVENILGTDQHRL